MTILVAYVSRPEGRAALDKAIEISKERKEPLLIVNASPGGQQEDASLVPAFEVEQIEEQLAAQGIAGEFKQFVRGKEEVAVVAIEELRRLKRGSRQSGKGWWRTAPKVELKIKRSRDSGRKVDLG